LLRDILEEYMKKKLVEQGNGGGDRAMQSSAEHEPGDAGADSCVDAVRDRRLSVLAGGRLAATVAEWPTDSSVCLWEVRASMIHSQSLDGERPRAADAAIAMFQRT